MAEIVWTGPASLDVLEIVEYIALDNPAAAYQIAARIERRVRQLERHPLSGSFVPEMRSLPLKQLVEPPCRIFYRFQNNKVYILHVLRSEQHLRRTLFEIDE
ncbi:MAG: type II toxin-antitoxin system RelE/ParE family toxin [Acidobacteriota bacterium]